MPDWLVDALRAVTLSEVATAFGVALAAALGYFAGAIKEGLRSVFDYFSRLRRARKAVARELGPSGLREGQGLWLTTPIRWPDHYRTKIRGSRILNVANLKGGVGKTTLTANLGAALAAKGKRVLMIDLDFQGSLSAMCRPEGAWLPPEGQDSMATKLISGELDGSILAQAACGVAGWERFAEQHDAPGNARLALVNAYYDLALAENRTMIEWLIGTRGVDPRYTLSIAPPYKTPSIVFFSIRLPA